MSRQKIRASNLRRLRGEFGTYRELAKRGETSEKYLSLVAGEKLQNGKPRMLGNDVAEQLEAACAKYPGWFDIDHDNPPPNIGDMSPIESELIDLWRQADSGLKDHIMALARLAKRDA